VARVLPLPGATPARPEAMQQHTDKPTWIDALEESLLLAIVLFSLITWIVMIGFMGH
jgi:hypothetical protein